MDNTLVVECTTVALVHFVAVMSPGPDFAVVVKESVQRGRRAGIITALGIACGLSVHIAYSLLGIGIIIAHSVVAFTLAKLVGGAYLSWIGIQALRSKPHDQRSEEVLANAQRTTMTSRQLFWRGFLTNALNPKATLFFLALFVAVISGQTPIAIKILYGCWMIAVTAVWFSLVACFLSAAPIRALFQSFGHWFDRVMGGALIALAIKLGLTEHSRG